MIGTADARTCIRDLLGLLALSLLWRSRDPRGILSSLLEALEACLPIALAYGRIPTRAGGCIELARVEGRAAGEDEPEWAALADAVALDNRASVETSVGTLRATHLPLGYHGARGRLVVASRHPDFPSESHSVVLRTAACLADAAVEAATLLEELRRQERERLLQRLLESQEQERRRISRDLHDHVGQQLTALRLGLEALPGAGGDLARSVGNLNAIVRKLDTDVALIAWELRPAALDDLGLTSALSSFVDQWSRQFGIPCRLHTSGFDIRPGPAIETTVFRIVQEALNNATKHSRAQHLAVILERRDDEISLVIEDDGVGFDDTTESDGIGLVGMRERAALIGGTLQVESVVGRGTSVFLRCPVTPPPLGVAG